MKFLNIIKDGIDNVVDEATYLAIYKPAGWNIVGESALTVELTKAPNDEIIKKNTNKMKRASAKKFNDNLIKEEDNGKI